MSKLLQIKTGIFADNSQSSRLADDFVQKWKAGHPDAEVIVRDFTTDPVPHLTAERFGAVQAPSGASSAADSVASSSRTVAAATTADRAARPAAVHIAHRNPST